MQKNKNRQGLALGAAIALVASLFGSVPAAQANETSLVSAPAGSSSATSMLITEEFQILTRYGTGVVDKSPNFSFLITKPAGVDLHISASGTLGTAGSTPGTISVNDADTIVTVANESSASNHLSIRPVGATSLSASVQVTVTPFLDLDGSDSFNGGDALGTGVTITFVPWSALATSVVLSEGVEGMIGITASLTVTPGDINFPQLNGFFGLGFKSTGDGLPLTANSATFSGVAGTTHTNVKNAAEMAAGSYSYSASVLTAGLSGSPVASFSAQAFYFAETNDFVGSSSNVVDVSSVLGKALAAASVNAVQADSLTGGGLTISAVAGNNLKVTDDTRGEARINSSFTLNAYGYSTSNTTSVAVARTFTVSRITGTWQFGPSAGIVIAGTTFTSSAALLAAGVTLPAGTNTVAMSTFGQTDNGAAIDFRLSYQLVAAATYTVTLGTPDYVVDFDGANASAPVGSAKTFAVEVTDQWDVAPTRTDLRVAASAVVSGSQSDTVSAAVSAGAASVTVTPLPATRTASDAVVTFTLQKFNQDTGIWDNLDTDTVNLNIYSAADAFVTGGGAAHSVSVSISHAVRDGGYTYSQDALTYTVLNSYSDVVVSAPGLVILDTNTADTASGTLTLQANAKAVSLKFAGTRAGTHVVTLTNGTATTTSLVIIDPAGGEDGTAVSIAVSSSALPQQSIDVTVTLVDAFGNPVETATASQLTLTATGAGFFSNGARSQISVTDEDGQATFTLTSGANDRGSLFLIATYEGTADASASAVVDIAPAPVILAGSVDLTGSASVIDGSVTSYTATVLDAAGAALAGRTVTFTAAGAQGGLTITSGVSDADGKVSTTFVSTAGSRGTLVITATVDGKNDSVTTTVTEDPAAVAAREAAEAAAAAAAEAAAVSTVTVAAAESLTLGLTADVTVTVKNSADVALAGKTVVINVTGAGYVNVQSVTTDANGQAIVKLISSAEGNAVITATSEGKSGNATVAIAAPVVTPTVEAVIGTFQGRWAVRVENATVGDRITIRVGGNWYQFNYSSETGSQLFSRKSKVGAIVDVTVWVNGSQKNVGLVTIK